VRHLDPKGIALSAATRIQQQPDLRRKPRAHIGESLGGLRFDLPVDPSGGSLKVGV
jgi:hypothetical protein